jgi:hypothetical protein
VSAEAEACPNCGYPVAENVARAKKAQRRELGALGCLGLLMVLFVIVLIGGMIGSKTPQTPAPAVESPEVTRVPTHRVQPVQVYMLTQMTHGKLAESELCSITKDIRDEAHKLIVARDTEGLAGLMRSGDAAILDKGTKVRGIEEETSFFSRSSRVRVLSGPDRGASCWTDYGIPGITGCASNIGEDSHDCVPLPK